MVQKHNKKNINALARNRTRATPLGTVYSTTELLAHFVTKEN